MSRDIEDLGGGHDKPSGTWSDGTTLWVLENGSADDDAIYAYDLKTGERVEDREFELDERNRAPRSVWSDRTVLWVSDSGQEKAVRPRPRDRRAPPRARHRTRRP